MGDPAYKLYCSAKTKRAYATPDTPKCPLEFSLPVPANEFSDDLVEICKIDNKKVYPIRYEYSYTIGITDLKNI